MLFIVDTSCLIILQKLGWLDELRQPDDTFWCPPKVIHELKNNKTLLKWINKGIVGVAKVEKQISITAISATDAEVISLALEWGGGLLSEDKELGKKAERLGVSVYNLAGLFMLFYMKITISMPEPLIAALDELKNQNGRSTRSRLIQKLLRDSLAREKQVCVAQLYVKGKKTLRQCAEIFGIDLEEMIDLLRSLNIPLDDGRSPQNKMALKIARQIRAQKTHV